MVLRALFWISLVWLLMPREPDLGFGRPGGHGLFSGAATGDANALAQPAQICGGREAACATGLSLLDSLQGVAVRRLAQVKADIEAEQRARERNG